MPAVEWSRPRTTPMAGNRKATQRWCIDCNEWHNTHRHADGAQYCDLLAEARRIPTPQGPLIKIVPRTASR